MTIYEMREKMAELGAQISAEADYIAKSAGDPTVEMKTLEEHETKRDECQKRFDMLKNQVETKEAAEKAVVEQKHVESSDPTKRLLKAKAEFYKTALMGGDVTKVLKAYEGLGAIPAQDADLGYGDNLLPTNLANELLTEPFETNSLRTIEPVTNITGLEEARLDFEIDDTDLADITDKDTATEIALKGNKVTYGRYETRLSVTVKSTVLRGTPFDIVTTIENGLRSALSIKEKVRAFDTAPDTEHAHMSFYSDLVGIKKISGTDMLKTIMQAWADLPDAFSEAAKVVMRRIDWVNALQSLLNTSETYFGKKPEDIIGIPVVFNDRATKPVVGDFRYSKQNYDIGTLYETDKDAKKGEYYYVLTAWGDHQIRLASAFRVVDITAGAQG